MSVLKVGGVGLGRHYKTLEEAVADSNLGDTIQIHKGKVHIDKTIVINHDVYIEGLKSTFLDVGDHLAAFVVDNCNVEFSNLRGEVGQSNFVVSAPNATQGSITMNDVFLRHRAKLSAREYFPLISCQGSDDSGMSVALHHCLMPNVTIAAPKIVIDRNSEIGRPLSAVSFLRAPQMQLLDSELSNVKVVNPTGNWMHLQHVSTKANLDLYGDFDMNGLSVLGLTLEKKKDLKKYDKQRQAFNQGVNQYAVLVHSNSDRPAKFQIQNFSVDADPLEAQQAVLNLAWFDLDNVNTTFVNTFVPNTLGSINAANGGNITLDQCEDDSAWELNQVEISNRNSTAPSLLQNQQQRSDDALKALQGMIGLKPVKEKITELISTADVTLRLRNQGKDTKLPPMHMVFGGNAGTGKTTVARLVAKALYEHGVLKTNNFKEASAKDLVSQNVGGTAGKTHKLVQSALDGVLFIDEAYGLAPSGGQNDFNSEAVNQLIADMENYRDRLVVIMAGYTDQMHQFFKEGNPGLQSRFRNWIDFPDYTVSELQAIADKDVDQQHLKADAATKAALHAGIEKIVPALGANSGNGRFIRNLIDDIVDIKNARVASNIDADETTLLTLTKADVEGGLHKIAAQQAGFTGKQVSFDTPKAKPQGDALKQLDGMIGLDNVKSSLRELVALAKVNHVAEMNGQKGNTITMHAIFAGNAGTGKTTVARIYAQALYQNGVLKTDNVKEVTAKDLVAGFVGQTADKTAKLVESALDGVLFIDEAYQLAPSNNGNDFNSEAVDELIAQMENHRDNLVVIMAGYTKEMHDFIANGNPGLQSRFRNWIEFPDYTTKQLDQILIYQIKHQHLLLQNRATLQLMMAGLNDLSKGQSRNSGNGRFVRNFVDALITAKAVRIAPTVEQLNAKQRNTINENDTKKAIAQIEQQRQQFAG